ncbi:molybdenum cofactor biosynthesis F family protein [Arthrobacter pigmenti]
MTSSYFNLSDTSTWLPLNGLAPGFDANKADPSHDLTGQQVNLTGDDGTPALYRFTDSTVRWEYQLDGDVAQKGNDSYEAFEVDTGLYYVQFQHQDNLETAVSLFLDLSRGRALTVIASIGDAKPGQTAVDHQFKPATIDNMQAPGDPIAPTRSLIGRRVMWIYSSEHAYEHLYLSPQWYTWQCLAGPERGLADTDENTTYQIRPGIYVFAWREKVIPCASVIIADHRNINAIRSHGYLFGLDESGTEKLHFTFGAYGRLLSTTIHPEQYDPAQPNVRSGS